MIDQVATQVAGDPAQQFVQVRMLAPGQTRVGGTVLGAFDATGDFLAELVVLDHDVAASGPWLMATAEFQTAHALAADFTFPSGTLPVGGGMLCWGAPVSNDGPVDPASWDHSDYSFYTDCVAYGAFCGRAPGGLPVPATPADHSLVRVGSAPFSDADFTCSPTLTPTNNAGATVAIAGVPCTTVPATVCGLVIAGGAARRSECWGEWVVRGAVDPRPTVLCRDGDASCDASRASGCLFRVQLCFDDAANARYGGRCSAVPLSTFTLRVRSKDDVDRENVGAVLGGVEALGGQARNTTVQLPELHDARCTPLFELAVPLGTRRGRVVPGRRVFQSAVVGPHVDRDRLTLVCRP